MSLKFCIFFVKLSIAFIWSGRQNNEIRKEKQMHPNLHLYPNTLRLCLSVITDRAHIRTEKTKKKQYTALVYMKTYDSVVAFWVLLWFFFCSSDTESVTIRKGKVINTDWWSDWKWMGQRSDGTNETECHVSNKKSTVVIWRRESFPSYIDRSGIVWNKTTR